MTEQKSRLVIEIDSRNSKKTTEELNKELKNLETNGNVASKGIKKVGDAAEKEVSKINGFKTGISKLAQEVNIGFASMAGTIVGTIGSAVTLGAIIALATQTANAAAEIEKLAYLSGTTPIQFQEWAVGARAMGVEMDKLSDIFKDTRDRIGEFTQEGSGELTKFFTEIATKTEGGTQGALKLANAMRELSGPDALLLYVQKLEEAGIAQNEFVTYMESVADEATLLIPLLENGGEGFELWAEAARNAGAIMDEETLAAAQRLKVETELLEMQIAGLRNQFLQSLLPALNQIAGAFLSTSEQGVQFNGVAESVANTLIWLSKVGMGVAATFDIIGKTIGGSIAAMTDKNVTHQMVLDDLGKTIDGWGTKFNKLNDPTPNNKLVDSLTKVQQRATEASKATASSAANTKAMQKALDGSANSSKKAADNTAKLRREAERALKDAQRLIYEYTSEFTRIETDLKNEIEKINNSSLKPDSKTRMIADATAISEARKKLYTAELDFELNEYNMSETAKLRAQTNIKKLRIDSTKGLLADERKLKKDSADMEGAHELGLIKLAKEQRIFQMQQGLMNANAQSERYWELERQRIMLNVQNLEERNQQLAIAKALQAEEKQSNLKSAVQQWGGINAEMTGSTEQYNLDKERFDRIDAAQELFDAEIALAGENYALKEQAYQAHVDRMKLIEDEYQVSSMRLQLNYGEQITGSMATIMKAMGGEQSKGYQVMYAISEGFAASQAALSLITNIAKASEIGFPQNIPMILGAMGQGAQIAAMLANIQAPTGYATGGHITGKGTGTSDEIPIMASNGEFMFKTAAVKSLGLDALNYMNATGKLPNQYSDGGLVTPKDTYRVGMGTVDAIERGANVQAERQAQANVRAGAGTSQNVNLNPNFVIVDERESLSDYLFSPDGTKAFVKFFKRNRSALGV
ncbi:MAG: hypothetical protein ACN6NV_08445 [Acinetobacter gandensis]|uniref:hypothetical protein n=1 Tax=Acinetobacter gandensis TaxID=1443941 RepID=UPI003CFC4319